MLKNDQERDLWYFAILSARQMINKLYCGDPFEFDFDIDAPDIIHEDPTLVIAKEVNESENF